MRQDYRSLAEFIPSEAEGLGMTPFPLRGALVHHNGTP
jgi:hypothetical protein